MLNKKEQGAIILLWASRNPHTQDDTKKDNFFPLYLKYDYGIDNPLEVYLSFLNDGYISRAPTFKVIPSLSSARLKEILRKHGLSQKGTKEDLIERIFSSVSEDLLATEISDEYYMLSEKGRELLDDQAPLIFLHQNPTWDTSYEEYMTERQSFTEDYSFRDVMWRIFNNRIATYANVFDWFGLRFTYFNLGDLSIKFDKDETRAVSFWLTTFMFDMNSAISRMWMTKSSGISDLHDFYKTYEPKMIYFPPYLISLLRKRKELICQIPFDSIIKPPTYNEVFSDDDYKYIINALANDKDFDSEKWDYYCDRKNIFWAFDALRRSL